MKSGLKESMQQLNKATTKVESNSTEFNLNIPQRQKGIPTSFTISSDIYDSIGKLAKQNKTTKTIIVKSIFDAVYENGIFNIDIDRKEDENKNLLNVKIDKDLNKSLKKLSKDKNKTFGELLEDIFNQIKKN